MDNLDLGIFKYVDDTIRNSRQKIWLYELDEDNWLEIIDTCDSKDDYYVVQFYKRCELVDTEIMYCDYHLKYIEDFGHEIKRIIGELYE